MLIFQDDDFGKLKLEDKGQVQSSGHATLTSHQRRCYVIDVDATLYECHVPAGKQLPYCLGNNIRKRERERYREIQRALSEGWPFDYKLLVERILPLLEQVQRLRPFSRLSHSSLLSCFLRETGQHDRQIVDRSVKLQE